MVKKIAIGIITCNRPVGLKRLLLSLSEQQITHPDYGFTVIVVDNDISGVNESIVDDVRTKTGLDLHFVHETERGIPFARNASVRKAIDLDADFFIYVDDDEIAPANWLQAFIEFYEEFKSDISTGPVQGILPTEKLPAWAVKSGAYDKIKSYARGRQINRAYTNNTMITKKVLTTMGPCFHPQFRKTGSSDRHYFRQAIKKGFNIRWCPEAIIEETVPMERISYMWILKRAFRSGAGDTISKLLLRKDTKTIIRIILLCIARAGYGFIILCGSVFTGWRGFISASKRIAASIGGFLGLFGINYNEYEEIVGE